MKEHQFKVAIPCNGLMNSGLTRDIGLFLSSYTSFASQKILYIDCRVTTAAAELLNQRHKQQMNDSLMTCWVS